MKLRAIAVALFVCVASPASAQVGFEHLFQGPWNGAAQRSAPASQGVPPRNAQCGWYLGRLTGHTDRSLWVAQNWARKFPRIQARPGAVVVWTRGGGKGHVAKIQEMRGSCRAVVQDNAGTYERDICRSVIAYVQP